MYENIQKQIRRWSDVMLKFIKYLKKYSKYIVGVIALTFFDVMTELYLPNLMSMVVDKGIVTGDTAYILSIGLRMLFVALLSTISMIVSSYLSSKVAMGVGRDLRGKLFSHVESFSLAEFEQVGTSSLITRTTNDITQLQQLTIMALRMMMRAPLMLAGGLIMAFSKNRELSMVLLVSMPILVVAVILVGKKAFPLFKNVQIKIDRMNLVLREKLTGVRVIRAFNRVDYEEERFADSNKDLADTALAVERLMITLFPLINLILNFATIAVVWFGSKQVDMGNMFIGDIMAFIQYVMLTMFSLIMFSVIFMVIPRAAASADRINEVLDIEPSIVDEREIKEIGDLETLSFENVEFSYPGAENPTLCDINFQAKIGETVAIIGGTGSGKSALINLLPRFFDVAEGAIKLNGVDIRELSQDDLRSRIGLVPQKAVLFTGSIKDNIRQGKEDATDEEIIHAAKIAQAEEFINELEEGYDSFVAQGGTNYSGGQKQRLSIARAVVRKPEIYVFDDSFSALDFKTDAKLREALEEETTESIVIIVAQRVSTVKDADTIIVLDDGRMAGVGTHQELMKESEVYKEIVRSQYSEEEV